MLQKYKVYINNRPELITDNWESFCSNYMLIEAAGGLVYNLENQLLMIFRNGKWDLPKGKLEQGENIRQCAIREVEEESGVSDLTIIKRITNTYHTYELKGNPILKRTYWYIMHSDFDGKLVAQIDEGVTKVEWVNEDDIANKLKNSYSNIKELCLNE
ncbi:NUDIX domain-containing protein [Flavobacteriales bacterium]|nr:NUDIX domain-containing protein [Flavobacteriales bacterium]